jgi:hypothetical protein
VAPDTILGVFKGLVADRLAKLCMEIPQVANPGIAVKDSLYDQFFRKEPPEAANPAAAAEVSLFDQFFR